MSTSIVRHLVTLCVLLAVLAMSTGAASAALLDAVAAHYALDGATDVVTDSQAGALHGFLGSAAGADANDPTRVTGYIGTGALDFTPGAPAVADIVNLAVSSSYVTTNVADAPRTISTWLNIDSFGTAIRDQGRLAVLHGGAGPSTRYSAAVGSSADAGVTGELNLAYLDGAFTEVNLGGTAFGTGWHHAAYVYDGTETKVYFDGELYASLVHGITTLSTTVEATLGAFASTGTVADGMDGELDDVGFWKRSLTPAEVAVVAAFGDASFVGLGNNLSLSSTELDGILGLSASGDSTLAAGENWFYTDEVVGALDLSPLALGKHYVGIDGELYIILAGSAGSFTGATTLPPVPEPSSLLLLGLGALGLVRHTRRRKK